MKYLTLFITMLFASEMEVDGDLKVTGTVESTTIDSLQQQINSLLLLIADLELRIANMECLNTGIIPEGYCDCFGNVIDLCGVCAGYDMSCTDCAGVVNGDNLVDMCGVCDNDLDNDCIDYALSFDGNDDYVFIDDVLPIDDEYTINIMVKRIGTGVEPLFWNGTVAGQPSWIEIYAQPNSFHNGALTIAHNRNMSNYSGHYFLPFPIDQWLYLSVVYQNGMVSIYYDGIFMESASMPLESNPGISEHYFGHTDHSDLFNNYLNGSVDRISIWNIALTSSEINTYMASSPVGNENGLIGYWNFNEGAGSTLYDQSGNGIDGTIHGNPEWVEH